MVSPQDTLARHYAQIDQVFQPRVVPELASLVVPEGNSEQPIHRWFHLKEAFSSKLLAYMLDYLGWVELPRLRILDPFAGVATTVVAAIEGRDNGPWPAMEAYGIECNPFLQLVANTKVQALCEGSASFEDFTARLGSHRRPLGRSAPVPELSTLHDERYFSRRSVTDLAAIRSQIDDTPGSDLDKNLARVCLAATVEPAGRLRKDGRALRYEAKREPCDVYDEFHARCQIVADDLRSLKPLDGRGSVTLGDGRRPSSDESFAHRPFDLVLFSPPYPNNIDYTEVYKLEAWSLGMYASSEDFRRQRLLTVRSHPSIRFPDVYEISSDGHKQDFDALVGPLRQAIPQDRYSRGRHQLVRGYFDDMLQTFSELHQLLADDGIVVYVVANSLHGAANTPMLIAADALMARLAESAGFEVADFMIARQPARRARQAEQLRESVVVLRKRRGNRHAYN